MKKNIKEYVRSIVSDNAKYIIEGHYTSIAEYIIFSAESSGHWEEYFNDGEFEAPQCEPTEEQIKELKQYLQKNFDYLPDCDVKDMIQTAEYEQSRSEYEKIEILKEFPLKEDATLYIWRGTTEEGYEVVSSCIVNDGEFFCLTDWQGDYPKSEEEIEDYNWVNISWRPAIVMNGLPRMLV